MKRPSTSSRTTKPPTARRPTSSPPTPTTRSTPSTPPSTPPASPPIRPPSAAICSSGHAGPGDRGGVTGTMTWDATGEITQTPTAVRSINALRLRCRCLTVIEFMLTPAVHGRPPRNNLRFDPAGFRFALDPPLRPAARRSPAGRLLRELKQARARRQDQRRQASACSIYGMEYRPGPFLPARVARPAGPGVIMVGAYI